MAKKTIEKEAKVVPRMIVESTAGRFVVRGFDAAWTKMRDESSLGHYPVHTTFDGLERDE